jgi:hypothetical protein
MATRTSALDLNACAVAFLRQGLCHEASSFLLQAIQHLTVSIEAEQQNRSHLPVQRRFDALSSRERSWILVRVESMNILDQVCTSSLQLSFSPGNTFQFFNKSFLIDLSDVNNEWGYHYSNAAQDQTMAAVLWYNWGVTYHYAAISRGQSKYLAKALVLYTKAFQILLQNINVVVNNSMVLLVLAVSNNMAYCSYHTGDATAARRGHDYIRGIMETFGYSSFDQEEYEFFYSPWNTRAIMSIAPAA